jgi:hypothetical protein
MSALPLKADMFGVRINVCFVPKADIRRWFVHCTFSTTGMAQVPSIAAGRGE